MHSVYFPCSQTPANLPATHHDSSWKGIGIFIALFSLVWGGVPGLILLRLLNSIEYDPAMFFMLLFPVIGLGLLAAGLWMTTLRKTIRIGSAYCFPDNEFIAALIDTAERNVTVSILTPGEKFIKTM